jgi:hypothetical protein
MNVLLLLTILTLATPARMDADSATYSLRDAARDLESLLVVDSSRYGASFDIDTLTSPDPLRAFAKANGHYILYLTINSPGAALGQVSLRDSRAAIKARALERLRADTAYLAALAESVERFRRSSLPHKGTSRLPEPPVRRQVEMDRLLDVASRFFYPDAILPDGSIQSHVCVGINGMLDMKGGRDASVEAFAYAAIFHDILKPMHRVDDDFGDASRRINALDLGADSTVRLLRAQGLMWGLMRRSEKLRRVLTDEYRRTRHHLPFILSDPAAARTRRAGAPARERELTVLGADGRSGVGSLRSHY